MSQDHESFGTVYINDRVARWQQGDRQAADELLRAVAGQLERLARKMLRAFPSVRGWADTCDVQAGATLRLLTALRTVQPNSTREFFGLSAVQIRRELLDLAEAHSRRRAVGLDDEQAAAIPARTSDEMEIWAEFHRAVETLPSEEREVVSLVFYHDWKQAQVAELLGVDERTIRRYWRSALDRLSEKLKGRLPNSQ